MIRYTPLIGLALLCLPVTVTRAQSFSSPDSAALTARSYPQRAVAQLQGTAARVQARLDRQTDKYVRRMNRIEQRLQGLLSKVDPGAATTLFSSATQSQYGRLALSLHEDSGRTLTSMGPDYLPYADSAQGLLGYWQRSGSGLSPAMQAQVSGTLGQWQSLQSRLQVADAIKAYSQQRQAALTEALSRYSSLPGLTAGLAGYRQQAWYYADQVRAFRAVLNDPGKALQAALSVANRIPAFAAYWQQHSFLAGLFGIPAGYEQGGDSAGWQSREQVLTMIRQQVGSSGGSGEAMLQSSLSAASQDITKLQNKLSNLGGGSGDMTMPDFSVNAARSRPLWRRLSVGLSMQTTPATAVYPTYTSLGASLSYDLGHHNSVGLGAAWLLGWGTPPAHWAFAGEGAGLRSFVDIHLKKSVSLTGGLDLNYLTPFSSLQDLRISSRWTPSGLVGLSKTVSMKSRLFKSTTLSLLWDFLSYSQTPATQPFVFRLGYGW